MSNEPTLREGDHEADGWVRYLQSTLAYRGHPVEASGTFDAHTKAAVKAFQQSQHLLADGVVGNQTWAALRGEAAQAVGTDGRQPHAHAEGGPRAEWVIQQWPPHYKAADDLLELYVVNVGHEPIHSNAYRARVAVTGAGGHRMEADEALYSTSSNVAAPGEYLSVLLTGVMEQVGGGRLQVSAHLPAELGGGSEQCEVDIGTAGHTPVVHQVSWVNGTGEAEINEHRGHSLQLHCHVDSAGPLMGGEFVAVVHVTNAAGQVLTEHHAIGDPGQLFHAGDVIPVLTNAPQRTLGSGPAHYEAALPAELGGAQAQGEISF